MRTPKSRKTGSRPTKDSIERARAKAPHGERCTISLNEGPCLEDCHVVCRSTNPDVLDCLEYAWGYNHRQFDVDTSDNLLLMRADWHSMYNAQHWMLVPTPNMVQKIYTHCMKFKDTLGSSEEGKWPPIDHAYTKAASYEYYVLAASSMSKVTLDRHTLTPDAEGGPAIPPRWFHRFPFDTLGLIESHILPQYAIFNCGRKILVGNAFDLLGRYELLTGNAAEVRNVLSQITELYKLWTTLAVPTAFKATSKNDMRQQPDASCSDEERDDNKPPRVKGASKKRKGHAHHIVPPPHDSDSNSACSIHSDTPLTEAEIAEMNDSLELVSAWRIASSRELAQGHRREKTVASREDIGEYAREPPRIASTVDLNPEGPPADYYPSHLVAASSLKFDQL